MKHSFTPNILTILDKDFGNYANSVFLKSELIQYLNLKTRSADKDSKSRSSFANLYAIYVLVEDYLRQGFDKNKSYAKYEGTPFSQLFARQRELPFGSKLQNHALNNRMNAEFQKFFPNSEYIPILRNLETNRYWINENLLTQKIGNKKINLATTILKIIDEYILIKQNQFHQFVKTCEDLQHMETKQPKEVEKFIFGLLSPNVDARLFEIVSYSILKNYYHEQKIYWGFELDNLKYEHLILYKTGRTNANDGGIDFVMKPLGRFFQVTETIDFKKYFLDIDKIQKYPITFVIKSSEKIDELLTKIRTNAIKSYSVDTIVEKYMACIEDIINIPKLQHCFAEAVLHGHLSSILQEIIAQSKVEFNYEREDE